MLGTFLVPQSVSVTEILVVEQPVMLWNNTFSLTKENYFLFINSLVYHKFESGSRKNADIFPVKYREDKNCMPVPKKCCESQLLGVVSACTL